MGRELIAGDITVPRRMLAYHRLATIKVTIRDVYSVQNAAHYLIAGRRQTFGRALLELCVNVYPARCGDHPSVGHHGNVSRS